MPISQFSYRWRVDDLGANTDGTWRAALNTNGGDIASKGCVIRIRVQLRKVGAPAETVTLKLRWGTAIAPTADVAATQPIEPADSLLITDGEAITAALLPPPAYTWVNGQAKSGANDLAAITFPAGSAYTEVEWTLRAAWDAPALNYYLWVTQQDNTLLGGYPNLVLFVVPADPIWPEIIAALRERIRAPRWQVLAYDGSTPTPTELDITEYVVDWRCERSLDAQLSSGGIVLDNVGGQFDPVGGALAAYVAEDSVIIIRAGYRWAGVDYLETRFTGLTTTGRARYDRGNPEVVTLPLLDMGKHYARSRVTTEKWQAVNQLTILQELLEDYGGWTGGILDEGSGVLRDINCQFEGEYVWEAARKLAQAMRRHIYFDEDGLCHLRDLATHGYPGSAWDYNHPDLVELEHEWGDPSANIVQVTGRDLWPVETIGAEETFVSRLNVAIPNAYMGLMWAAEAFPTGDISYTDISVTKTQDTLNALHWLDVQAVRYATQKEVNDWLIRDWYIGTPPADTTTLYIFLEMSKIRQGAGGLVGWDIDGSPIKKVVPYLWDEARDFDLVAQYGEIVETIENPLLWELVDCQDLAEWGLETAKLARYRFSFGASSGNPYMKMAHTITAWNPRTRKRVWLLIWAISESGSRDRGYEMSLECLKAGETP